jgi:uncharacterized protein (TIGR02588 family)
MKKPQKNAVEWTVFAISACVVALAVGYLVRAAVLHKKTPPALHIATGTAEATHAGYRIEVKVENDGDITAEEVRIEIALRRGDEEVERAELDIIYVPRKSARTGWVIFRNDPRCCEVVSRAMSYDTP